MGLTLSSSAIQTCQLEANRMYGDIAMEISSLREQIISKGTKHDDMQVSMTRGELRKLFRESNQRINNMMFNTMVQIKQQVGGEQRKPKKSSKKSSKKSGKRHSKK